MTLAYDGESVAAISVPSNSIYKLEYDLPITNLLPKGFTRSRFDLLQEEIQTNIVQKESSVLVSGVQDIGEMKTITSEQSGNSERTKAVRFGLRMAFEMERIPVIFPSNNIFLTIDPSGKQLPVTPIVFGQRNKEAMQAFVWRVRPDQQIVWNGLVSKRSKRVLLKLAQPGTYVFQAFGLSGKSRTRSIRIVVSEPSEEQSLFPSGAIAGDTIIVN